MLFNSWQYLVFLPIVLITYWVTNNKYRWAILLFASYYFYMSWNAKLIVLIGTTTLVSYISAIMIDKANQQKTKKIWLVIACVISLGILFFYKYFNFFSVSVTSFLRSISLPVDDFTLKVMLPVGISFYTFQTLSYVIDVYKGDLKVEKHLGIYALYVSFFPQLVAGPIERATNLLPQFHRQHTPSPEKWAWGLRMITFGLFKKVIVADFVAPFVTEVYKDVYSVTPMTLVIATVLFSIQIYCDFSGYSDIALGSAKLLDFDLMKNFKTPYFARSIQEFWRRWHISLSTFFGDYVYKPLGGSRKGDMIKYRNVLIVFLISGLWHGASWTFVLWGLFHAVLQIFSGITKDKRSKLRAKLKINENSILFKSYQTILVFALVCFSYILFRANSITDALYVFATVPKAISNPITNFTNSLIFMDIVGKNLFRMIVSFALLFINDLVQYNKGDTFEYLSKQKSWIRFSVSYIMVMIVLVELFIRPATTVVEFIYFQF